MFWAISAIAAAFCSRFMRLLRRTYSAAGGLGREVPYALAATGASASGRVRDGSTLTPGPIVEASVIDLM